MAAVIAVLPSVEQVGAGVAVVVTGGAVVVAGAEVPAGADAVTVTVTGSGVADG
ncbi:hypothetical protein AAFP30_05900 [Gordonia sp. CPCC 205515]|uniref:hypothetical protein n=1 Tax=Gordonia sp. CPCC 205515 TaxID=3140791 RepID=UPI003AF3B811